VAVRGGGCVIVHATDRPSQSGPPGAHHIAARDAEKFFSADEQRVTPVLAILDAIGNASSRRAARFRRAANATRRLFGRREVA
jgi:hypothetical protein